MKTIIIGVIIFISLSIGVSGGYFSRNSQVNKLNKEIATLDNQQGSNSNFVASYKTQVEELEYGNSLLVEDYNKLVEDYNTLRENVIKYVGSTAYNQRTSITCNSSTYGIDSQYSTTTCR